MPEAELPKHLGDYELLDLVKQRGELLIFDAIQLSVQRPVAFVLLHPDHTAPEAVENFRADVRAKASVHQVHIGPIFEIQHLDGYHFYTRQKVAGRPISEIASQQETLSPTQIFAILKAIAQAFAYLEENQIENRPLSLDHIFLSTDDVCHLQNTAIAGQREDSRSSLDFKFLGEQLTPLVELDAPGAGRAHTLLSWMRGEEREQPLTPTELEKLCLRVADQFTSASLEAASTENIKRRSPSNKLFLVSVGFFCCILALGIGLLITSEDPPPLTADSEPSPTFLAIPAGSTDEPSFKLTTRPVSIREYAEFLNQLDQLTPEEQQKFSHPDQAATKQSFLPTDWEAMLAAASSGGSWESAPLSLDDPIRYVDYWDAWAYAQFRQAQLASESEWSRALDYCRSEALPSPRTLRLREWTNTRRRKASFPMGPQYPKVLLPIESASPFFTFVENRSLRSSDLSFRIIYRDPPIPEAKP